MYVVTVVRLMSLHSARVWHHVFYVGEGGTSTLYKSVSERFQLPAEHRPSSVHVVGMELHLSPFYNDLAHVARFGKENYSALELDVVIWD